MYNESLQSENPFFRSREPQRESLSNMTDLWCEARAEARVTAKREAGLAFDAQMRDISKELFFSRDEKRSFDEEKDFAPKLMPPREPPSSSLREKTYPRVPPPSFQEASPPRRREEDDAERRRREAPAERRRREAPEERRQQRRRREPDLYEEDEALYRDEEVPGRRSFNDEDEVLVLKKGFMDLKRDVRNAFRAAFKDAKVSRERLEEVASEVARLEATNRRVGDEVAPRAERAARLAARKTEDLAESLASVRRAFHDRALTDDATFQNTRDTLAVLKSGLEERPTREATLRLAAETLRNFCETTSEKGLESCVRKHATNVLRDFFLDGEISKDDLIAKKVDGAVSRSLRSKVTDDSDFLLTTSRSMKDQSEKLRREILQEVERSLQESIVERVKGVSADVASNAAAATVAAYFAKHEARFDEEARRTLKRIKESTHGEKRLEDYERRLEAMEQLLLEEKNKKQVDPENIEMKIGDLEKKCLARQEEIDCRLIDFENLLKSKTTEPDEDLDKKCLARQEEVACRLKDVEDLVKSKDKDLEDLKVRLVAAETKYEAARSEGWCDATTTLPTQVIDVIHNEARSHAGAIAKLEAKIARGQQDLQDLQNKMTFKDDDTRPPPNDETLRQELTDRDRRLEALERRLEDTMAATDRDRAATNAKIADLERRLLQEGQKSDGPLSLEVPSPNRSPAEKGVDFSPAGEDASFDDDDDDDDAGFQNESDDDDKPSEEEEEDLRAAIVEIERKRPQSAALELKPSSFERSNDKSMKETSKTAELRRSTSFDNDNTQYSMPSSPSVVRTPEGATAQCTFCMRRVPRRDMSRHVASDCKLAIVQCDLCDERVRRWNLEQHIQTTCSKTKKSPLPTTTTPSFAKRFSRTTSAPSSVVSPQKNTGQSTPTRTGGILSNLRARARGRSKDPPAQRTPPKGPPPVPQAPPPPPPPPPKEAGRGRSDTEASLSPTTKTQLQTALTREFDPLEWQPQDAADYVTNVLGLPLVGDRLVRQNISGPRLMHMTEPDLLAPEPMGLGLDATEAALLMTLVRELTLLRAKRDDTLQRHSTY